MNIEGEIKCHLGDDYAHLKFSESGTAFSIDIVMVPAAHRNRGIGTLLVSHIIHLAERTGKSINVSARPLGASSEKKLQRLIAFYQRLGFTIIDRGLTVAYMTRKTVPLSGSPLVAGEGRNDGTSSVD